MNSRSIAAVFLLILYTIMIATGCSITSKMDNKAIQGVMTKDDVIKLYENLKDETTDLKPINLNEFEGDSGKFVLAELENTENIYKQYELVTMESGNREKIPLSSESDLIEIINENQLVFLSKGIYPDGTKSFPYISRCIRIRNDDPLGEKNSNFICVREDKYFEISEPNEYGGLSDSIANIIEIIPTLNGIQVLYKYDFIAGGVFNPITKVNYDKENNRLLLNIENCKISSKQIDIDKSAAVKYYFKSIEMKEKGNNCTIAILLSNNKAQYTVKTGVLKEDSPYFELLFK